MPGWAIGLLLEMLVSLAILIIGLRRDSVVMIVVGGSWFLSPLAFIALLVAFFAGPGVKGAFVLLVWYGLVGGIWAAMAFLGFKHLDTGKGKALVVFAVLWSFIMPLPLFEVCEWSSETAYLTTFGLTGLGYVIIGLFVRRAQAAESRSEALRMQIHSEIESQRPPWE